MNLILSILAPLILHSNGSYALSAVKEMRISEDFMSLGKDLTKCQVQEEYEECSTRIYQAAMIEQCNCIPYSLGLGKNQVYEKTHEGPSLMFSADLLVYMFK